MPWRREKIVKLYMYTCALSLPAVKFSTTTITCNMFIHMHSEHNWLTRYYVQTTTSSYSSITILNVHVWQYYRLRLKGLGYSTPTGVTSITGLNQDLNEYEKCNKNDANTFWFLYLRILSKTIILKRKNKTKQNNTIQNRKKQMLNYIKKICLRIILHFIFCEKTKQKLI